MSDQDGTIFSPEPVQTPVQTPAVVPAVTPEPAPTSLADPYTDLLKGITTEDGRQKYATVSDAINALPHAQTHIAKLELEATAMREQLAKAQSVEDVVNQLKQAQPTDNPPQGGLTEQSVAELVQLGLQQHEVQAVKNSNLLDVNNAMIEKFGDKAKDVMQSRSAELGMSVDMLRTLAEETPAAYKQLFGLGSVKQTVTNHLESTVNTQSDSLNQQPAPVVKNVMFGATKADIKNAWDAAGAAVNK